MTDDVSKDDCWREALALLLRWQAQPDDGEIKREITEFCAQGDDHLSAWLEAKKVYRIGGIALDAGFPAHEPKRVSRRQVLLGVGLLGLAGGSLAYRRGSTLPAGTTRTQIAEIREMTLEDGTRVSAGPYTSFSVLFDGNRRVLELQDGLLYCSIASDHRPFVLNTAEMDASCSSAVIEVTADDRSCCLTVSEGIAQARFKGGAASGDEINPGDWIRVGRDTGVERGHSDPDRAAQWRTGTLVVDNERVEAVVGRISRWQRSKVFIPQSQLATARVSGLYDLSDPLLAMQAVVGPHGGHVRQVSPWAVVLTTL